MAPTPADPVEDPPAPSSSSEEGEESSPEEDGQKTAVEKAAVNSAPQSSSEDGEDESESDKPSKNPPLPESGYYRSWVMREFDPVGLRSGIERYMQQGFELLEESTRAELEEKRRKLQHEEFELCMKKIDLMQMVGRLVNEALKSAQH